MVKEWLKNNWYWLLIIPVAGYFFWIYYRGDKAMKDKMAKVREAREEKLAIERAIKELDNPVNEN